VGVRSPYGTPRNPHRPQLIPGGSSAGSGVAVAAGLVPVALGTDTAGSGRVPAGLNNIVGLKPSFGLVPTAGVVPACRSLDCVSVFALTSDDAFAALQAMTGPDERDALSRSLPLGSLENLDRTMRIGVPRPQDRTFFGDRRAEAAFAAAIAAIGALDATIVDIDLAPFLEAARLLYEGPWLAERYAAVGDFINRHPEAVHPVTRGIILDGRNASAAGMFRAFYRLAELRAAAQRVLATLDVLMVPTVPLAPTIDEVLADPVGLNSRLGTYTNFVNLLDLAAVAVPAAIAEDGTPFGVTFLARAGQDAELASVARVFHALTGLPLGAIGLPHPPLAVHPAMSSDTIAIAVVGAHLSGMPLNGELRILGARFAERCCTAHDYRLFALPGKPRKPGLLRVASGQGATIEVELWSLPIAAFGRFIAAVPLPLSIGVIRLADGRQVKGFLVEAVATEGARDISRFGGWRAYLAEAAAGASNGESLAGT